jgi:hypothetical protein
MNGADIVKKYEALKGSAHGNWMNLWQECQDWAMPTNDNINRIRVEGQEKPPQRMIDTCIEANFNFASGFFSHMFPPNTIWAKFRHPDPNINAIPAVADYFEKVSRTVHSLLTSSNFAQEEFQALLCMGSLGTNILSVEEDEKSTVRFRNHLVNKVVLDIDKLGRVDTVGIEFKLTPRQAVQMFGEDALKEAELESCIQDAMYQRDRKYKFVHMVCPRESYDSKSKNIKNKPFASYWVSCDTKQIVKESGFDYNPYCVGRFTTGNDEIYGRSPMSMVLGTARRTNVIYRSMIVSSEQNSNPQWLVPDDDSVSGISGRAGALIKWRATNPNGKPERLQTNGDPGVAVDMYELHDSQIKRMFFNHLFRSLDDYRNMTAYEVQERMTVDRMSIVPFTSRYLEEKVSPLLETVYFLLQKKGKLPPIPEELPNGFEIDYVGPLALATKSFESLGAVNTVRVFNELGQLNPKYIQAQDFVNADQMLIDNWHSNSASMASLNDRNDVEEDRMARQQAAQQQQQIDNLAPVADATQKMSGEVDPNSIIANLQG